MRSVGWKFNGWGNPKTIAHEKDALVAVKISGFLSVPIYKKFDFYLGGENLTNSTQKNPIIDAANPFGSKFDATNIYMPITGINIYVGIRYAIAKNKK